MYWITAEWKQQGFEFNFPASLDLQRAGGVTLDDAADPVIGRGDLLHVDFGVRTSGIVADQQKMAYVLREGETAPPAGLVRAFADSARAASIILEEMRVGRTGAAIKQAAEARTAAGGIDALVYSHVQGYWVHDAGMWAIHDWPERYGAHPRSTLKDGDWVFARVRGHCAGARVGRPAGHDHAGGGHAGDIRQLTRVSVRPPNRALDHPLTSIPPRLP